MLAEIRSKLNAKGQTIVEVTLIFLFMVLMVGAAVDWGVGLFVSHVVQNAVREGARVAVTQAPTVSATAVKSVVQSVIPNSPIFSAFSANNSINVCPTNDATTPCASATCTTPGPFLVRVETSGTYNFTFLRLLGFSQMSITRDASMRYERSITNCPTVT